MSSTYYDPRPLQEARERKGLSRFEVARLLETYEQKVYRAERGKGKPPFVRRLCEVYDIPFSGLVDTPMAGSHR